MNLLRGLALVVLVQSVSPSPGILQVVSFVTPFAVAGVLAIVNGVSARASVLALLILASSAVGLFFSQGSLVAFGFGIFTHGAAALVLARSNAQEADLRFISRSSAVVLGIHGCVGIGQYVARNGLAGFSTLADGDHVVGLLGDNSHLFALQMLVGLLIVSASIDHFPAGGWRRLRLGATAVMLIAFVLASAMHLFVVLVFALAVGWVLFGNPWRPSSSATRHRPILGLMQVVVLASAMVSLLFLFQPGNVEYARRYILTAAEVGTRVAENPSLLTLAPGKLRSMYATAVELPVEAPYARWVGVGLGQYSSRAALMLSGEYLSTPLPVRITSPYTERFITPLWNARSVLVVERQGVANQPFSTVQTLAAEIGLPALMLLIFLPLTHLRLLCSRNPSHAIVTAGFGLVLLWCACGFDNWLEYPKVASILLFHLRATLDSTA